MKIRFVVKKTPVTCEGCPMVRKRIAKQNESITGSNYYCNITGKSLYWLEFRVAREDSCPLEENKEQYESEKE